MWTGALSVLLATLTVMALARAVMGVNQASHPARRVAGAAAVGLLVVIAMMFFIILLSLWDHAMLPPAPEASTTP